MTLGTVLRSHPWLSIRLDRRDLLRFSAAAGSTIALSSLLAACSGDSDDDDDTSATTTSSDATVPGGTGAESTSQTDAGGTPTRGGTLTYARSGDSDSLDPHHTGLVVSSEVFYWIFEPLVTVDENLEYVPNIVESWEVSDDGLNYFWTVREGLTFHDGTALDAEAVRFSFARSIDPATGNSNASDLGPLEVIEVVEPGVVHFGMGGPFAPLIGNLTSAYHPTMSPTAVEKYGSEFGQNPVGSGPFKFKEWIVSEHITLERFDDYQGFRPYIENHGAPYLDQLIFRTIPEEQSKIAAFEAQEVNYITVTGQQAGRFLNNPDYSVHQTENLGVNYLDFVTVPDGDTFAWRAPFDDLKVRQAVAHAINVDEIIDGVLAGFAIRNFGPMPFGNFAYDPAIEEFGYHYDQEQAKSLLDEAGWTGGDGGVRQRDGNPLSISFWSTTDPTAQRIAQVIQNHLQQVGFEVNLEALEVGTFYSRLDEGEWDIATTGVTWFEPDIVYWLTLLERAGFGRYAAMRPEVADIFIQARTVTEIAERKQFYFEAQKAILADAAIVPMYTERTIHTTQTNVKGFKIGPQNNLTYQDVYIEED